MNKKGLLLILIGIIVLSCATVSAGLFDGFNDNTNLTTPEFNYANKATFNLSDELTNKTGVENILFGEGVSYEYPAKDGKSRGLVNMLGGLVGYGGSDTVESKQNNAIYEEIQSDPTSQGYKSYIFKLDGDDEYQVYIDLNNMTLLAQDGFEENYSYFMGTFQNLDEAKIFIKSFKINDAAIKS